MSFIRSQSIQEENKRTLRTQIICDVENFKAGRNPVRKPRFCKRRVWMQVKVKIPVKRIFQAIPETVLAKFVFSPRIQPGFVVFI